jgi:hypothetical protein
LPLLRDDDLHFFPKPRARRTLAARREREGSIGAWQMPRLVKLATGDGKAKWAVRVPPRAHLRSRQLIAWHRPSTIADGQALRRDMPDLPAQAVLDGSLLVWACHGTRFTREALS